MVPPKTIEELKSALPDTSKPLRLKGLNASIEIYRDRYGIPHVKAQSVHDAFLGQGFVAAQDRLWQMEVDRRRAYGRWAEYAGKAAVAEDEMMRRFQIGPSVRADYEAINRDTKAMLDAYAAGVNAFMDSSQTLSIEYSLIGSQPQPWRSWDSLAVFKVRHIHMGTYEGKLWRARLVHALGSERTAKLFPGTQPGDLLVLPPGATYDGPLADGLPELRKAVDAISWLKENEANSKSTDAGSNSWVLAGNRARSGKPLLAGDPHRALDTPNAYYQNHVSCPEFDVIGLSFAGCPGFPHFGHNAHVAWCITHASADYQDLYVERFKSGKPPLVEFKGQWREAQVRHETIKVRGEEPIEMDVAVTDHGPVIIGDPAAGYGIAFRYSATAGPNTGFECVLKMLKATNVDELDESMRGWVDPCNNFLFADVQGNIGYLNRGQVPIRSMDNAWLPVPGWTGEDEWQGFIPFEELGRSRNPDTGTIVTANNRILGREYPYYISLDFAPDFRARRITERLSRLHSASVEDMAAIHADRVSIPGQTYSRLLAHVEARDELSARAKDVLIAWNGSMDQDAVAPTIYSAFRDRLQRLLVGYWLGPLADDALSAMGRGVLTHLRRLSVLFLRAAEENDTSLLPPGSTWPSLMSQALADGVTYLKERMGDDFDSWQWGKVHFTRPRHTLSASFPELAHLLDPPSLPAGGDGDTPQAAAYSPADLFTMTGSLSVARYVFDTSDWSNSAWIIPLGASGHPGSVHYADQAPLWAELKLIPMVFDWERITADAESHQLLHPV